MPQGDTFAYSSSDGNMIHQIFGPLEKFIESWSALFHSVAFLTSDSAELAAIKELSSNKDSVVHVRIKLHYIA